MRLTLLSSKLLILNLNLLLILFGVYSFLYQSSNEKHDAKEHYSFLYNTVEKRRPTDNTEMFEGDTLSKVTTDDDNGPKRYPRLINTLLTSQYPDLAERFEETVQMKLAADHETVVGLARQLLDPPIYRSYKMANKIRHTPQSEYLAEYFNQTGSIKPGFFVECGALDGERSSNTLPLEFHYNWTGLLIEADPFFYTQLRGKKRFAWSINACLSPSKYTMWVEFHGSSLGGGRIINETESAKHYNLMKVPCFPLESMLLALGHRQVDMFSLDVEGLEIPILKAIPHDRLDIPVWTIEYPKDEVERQELVDVMEGYGYTMTKEVKSIPGAGLLGFARDYVFVKTPVVNK